MHVIITRGGPSANHFVFTRCERLNGKNAMRFVKKDRTRWSKCHASVLRNSLFISGLNEDVYFYKMLSGRTFFNADDNRTRAFILSKNNQGSELFFCLLYLRVTPTSVCHFPPLLSRFVFTMYDYQMLLVSQK